MRRRDSKGHRKDKSLSFRRCDDPTSFLTQNPFLRLIGGIFEEFSDQLYDVLKRLDKLRAFSLDCIAEEKSGQDARATMGQGAQSFERSSSRMSEEEYDAERQRLSGQQRRARSDPLYTALGRCCRYTSWVLLARWRLPWKCSGRAMRPELC